MKESGSITLAELTTERLLLRQLKGHDTTAIAELRSDVSVNRYIDRPKELSIDAAAAFIIKMDTNVQEGRCFYWAICLPGKPELIGTICLFNFSGDKKSAELGYELHPRYQGKGYADEAVSRIISFAFQIAGFDTLEACVHQEHIKSVNLLLKNNFTENRDKKEEKYPDYVFFILCAG